MKSVSKLVVLRGPSGSGKSTVASLLHERASNKTALIEQDYYRHVMFNNLHTDLEAPRYVMFAGVETALDHGYDVILEGFMGMGKYKSYFDELLEHHPDNNHFFYSDEEIINESNSAEDACVFIATLSRLSLRAA